MTRRLFLDLDGVMADFDVGFERLFGMAPADYCDTFGDDGMWERIHSEPNFFFNLPPCTSALAAFEFVRSHPNLSILTACPKSAYKHVAAQKRSWVRMHLGTDVTVIPTCGGSTKPLFMHSPGDILIDDFERNTKAWTKAGGVAILHTDWQSTLSQLANL